MTDATQHFCGMLSLESIGTVTYAVDNWGWVWLLVGAQPHFACVALRGCLVLQNEAESNPSVVEELHSQLIDFFKAHAAHTSVLQKTQLDQPGATIDQSDPYDLL